MADQLIDSFYYVDGANVVKKETWRGDDGRTFDTFTRTATPSNGLPNGTIVSGSDVQGATSLPAPPAQNYPTTGNSSSGSSADAAQSIADQYYGAAVRENSTQNASNEPGSRVAGGSSSFNEQGGSYAGTGSPGNAVTQPYRPPAQTPPTQGGSNVSNNPNTPLGPNPKPVMPIGSVAPTGPANAPSGTTATGTSTLTNWDNPVNAMVNAMRMSGTNVNALNPYFQTLMRAAPGLASAYLIQGAGANTQSPDYNADFGNFLQNALRSDNIPSILKNAAGSLGSIIPQARAYINADQSGATNPLASNQLLGALSSMLGGNNGADLLNVIANLNTPFMNRSSANAYSNLLAGPKGLGNQANFQLGANLAGLPGYGTPDPSRDFWWYLLGQ